MSEAVRRFLCRRCRHAHVTWEPRCAACQGMEGMDAVPVLLGTQALKSTVLLAPEGAAVREPRPYLTVVPSAEEAVVNDDEPERLSEVSEASFVRYSTGLAPLDYVLGGGLVEGSVVLLACPPGVGKTTLTLQMLAGLPHQGLYATGEETKGQLAATARRINAAPDHVFVLAANDLDRIFEKALTVGARTVALDSIQKMTCADVSGRAGSISQLKESTARAVIFAKSTKTTLWLIGHVTSDGDIAGPKTIEHDVDVVLELTQGAGREGRERILKMAGKNRFGNASREGRFELTDMGHVCIDEDGWDEKL